MPSSPISKSNEEERLRHEARRWEYVKAVARRDGMSLAKAAQHYSIDERVISEHEFAEVAVEKKSKRSDKYAAIKKFCRDNVGAEVTTQQVADIGGISYPTALKFVTDYPNTFRKTGRGKYEIRDEDADRKADLHNSKGKD
jgi:hypothetical protein